MLQTFFSKSAVKILMLNGTFSPPLVVHSSFEVKTYEFAGRDFDQSNL